MKLDQGHGGEIHDESTYVYASYRGNGVFCSQVDWPEESNEKMKL